MSYLSPLSPVMRKALLSSSTEQVNHLHTVDSSALKQFFCEKAIDTLINKQKMLVVIPDGMPTSVPAKLLSPYQLAHYTMHYNRQENISEAQIELLQKLRRLNEINTESGAFKKSSQQLADVKAKINYLLRAIHEDNEQGPSLKDLILNNVDDPNIYVPKHISTKIFDMPIDERTLSSLDRLQSSYKPYYSFINSSAQLTRLALESEISLQQATDEVTTLSQGLSEVIKSLELELESAYNTLEKAINTECAAWQSIKKELELAIFNNDLSDGATSFDTAYQEIMAPAKKLFYMRLALERKPELNWGEAELLLQGINGLIEGKKASLEMHYRSLLKRMTPFNITKPELKDIVDKSMSIIRAINKSDYIAIDIPTKYLQIGELRIQMNKAFNHLLLTAGALQDKGYCDYVILSNKIGIDGDILSYLLRYEQTSWRSVVNHRVRQHMIGSRYDEEIKSLNKQYQELKPLVKINGKAAMTEVHNLWSIKRDKAITDIKNAHWDLYKSIWTESNCEVSTAVLYAQVPDALTSFCPITTVCESDLPHILETYSDCFDEVVFLDNRELQNRRIDQTYTYIKKITVATSYDIDLSGEFESDITVKSFYSSDLKLPEQSILGIAPGTERYRQVLPIATALHDIMKSVTIYKVVDKVIYSFADPQINQLLEERLQLTTRNILYRDTSDITAIVESLMMDKEHVIFIEDGLINNQLSEDIYWQRQVLSSLESTGLEILNLNFSALFADRSMALEELCDKISEKESLEDISTEQSILALA